MPSINLIKDRGPNKNKNKNKNRISIKPKFGVNSNPKMEYKTV